MGFKTDIKKTIESTGKYKVRSVTINYSLPITHNGKYKVMTIRILIKNETK